MLYKHGALSSILSTNVKKPGTAACTYNASAQFVEKEGILGLADQLASLTSGPVGDLVSKKSRWMIPKHNS